MTSRCVPDTLPLAPPNSYNLLVFEKIFNVCSSKDAIKNPPNPAQLVLQLIMYHKTQYISSILWNPQRDLYSWSLSCASEMSSIIPYSRMAQFCLIIIIIIIIIIINALSDDLSTASSKARSPQTAIWCFPFQCAISFPFLWDIQ